MGSAPENNVSQWASYELPLIPDEVEVLPASAAPECLSEPLLRQNIFWFCRLRYLVIGILALYGLLGLSPHLMTTLSLSQPGVWPFATALGLSITNLMFYAYGRERSNPADTRRNLWGQICLDLLILTIVIHFVGSKTTYASFMYLFHIVLACVFFVPRDSLLVTAMAILLYGLCITLESLGIIRERCMYIQPWNDPPPGSMPVAMALNTGSAIGIWIVVWYLASYLSTLVRTRDMELNQTNQRLEAALKERTQHMLHTTHELKSPFAAIHTNTQLLLEGGYGALSGTVAEVVQRIGSRCHRLSREIQEMLQLANLQSIGQGRTSDVDCIELEGLLEATLARFATVAQKRQVTLIQDLKRVSIFADEDHLHMLVDNLLSNAIFYSRPGGTVTAACGLHENDEPFLIIQDEGIGIAPDKLPRIFEDYYRAKEAVKHYSESSGLGLAIVRHVAQINQVQIRVESRLGRGTRFVLHFPVESRGNDQQPCKE